MFWNDASFLEIHVREHHPFAGDQPALQHVGDPLFFHRVPAVERALVFRGHALPVLVFAQGVPSRSNTTRPPTIVYMIRASRMVSDGIRVRSRSMIIKFSRFPGARGRFFFFSFHGER